MSINAYNIEEYSYIKINKLFNKFKGRTDIF